MPMPTTGQKYLFAYITIDFHLTSFIAKVKKLPCWGGIDKFAFKRAYLTSPDTTPFLFHCVNAFPYSQLYLNLRPSSSK